jgi:hypothetical protein
MSTHTEVPRSRRGVLAGGLGVLAALAASALGRPPVVRGTDDEIIHVGDELTAASVTRVTNATNGESVLEGVTTTGVALRGTSAGTGTGVVGSSTGSRGVYGISQATSTAAIVGRSQADATGVLGVSEPADAGTFPTNRPKTGVHGYAVQDSSSIGVLGESAAGNGVRGASNAGIGVKGETHAASATQAGVLGVAYDLQGSADGVRGRTDSPNGAGIHGDGLRMGVVGLASEAPGAGVVGGSHEAAIGVVGYSTSAMAITWPDSRSVGVYGLASDDGDGRGIVGESESGYGVQGLATTGRAVTGEATTGTAGHFATTKVGTVYGGYALRAVGRVRFDQCAGVATIMARRRSRTVRPGIGLTPASAVVATLMGSAGGTTTVHRVVVHAATNTFTIYLTAPARSTVKVAWHVFG